MAGSAALNAGKIAKLKGEILLVEREIKGRKQTFGVQLYDFVAPLASRPDFFAANDKLTDTIRGPFLAAQREIAALGIKRQKIKEDIAQAEITRRSAFPTPAATAIDKVKNAGKSAALAGNEAKLATELSMVEANINNFKQEFGVEMFAIFMHLEDTEGWLPTVREIRNMYDQTRQDVDKLIRKKLAKETEIVDLNGGTVDGEASKPADGSTADANGTNGGLIVPVSALDPKSAEHDSGPTPPPYRVVQAPAQPANPYSLPTQPAPYMAPAQPVVEMEGAFQNAPVLTGVPAAPAPAPYDPFSLLPETQAAARAAAANDDPFSGFQQRAAAAPQVSVDPFANAPPIQPYKQDPFAGFGAAAPAPAHSDPFAGL